MSRIYRIIKSATGGRYGLPLLCALSFTESSICPIPPDILLIPMIAADKSKAWKLSFYCFLFSVLGGVLGYYIGNCLFETLGTWVIETYGLQNQFQKFSATFREYSFWIIALKGFTPVPYKVLTIAGGFASVDILIFIAASIVARGSRFALLGFLCYRFGWHINEFLMKNMWLFILVTMVVVIVGITLVYYF